MPTTWEILTGMSTLPVNGVNTSYDHLVDAAANGGGGGPVTETVYRTVELTYTLEDPGGLSFGINPLTFTFNIP